MPWHKPAFYGRELRPQVLDAAAYLGRHSQTIERNFVFDDLRQLAGVLQQVLYRRRRSA
jgi:hypothetical protein